MAGAGGAARPPLPALALPEEPGLAVTEVGDGALHAGGEVEKNAVGGGRKAGVGGKNGRGKAAALAAQHRKDGKGDIQRTAAEAGQIVNGGHARGVVHEENLLKEDGWAARARFRENIAQTGGFYNKKAHKTAA